MSETEIKPQKITKPIQLLAAWLVGLILVNGSFLSAAAAISTPSWVSGLLVIASVVNVPVFLMCIFLLQTKFRPEMQEDTYYSQYLEKQYSHNTVEPKPIDLDNHFKKLTQEILSRVEGVSEAQVEKVSTIVKESEVDALAERFSDNRTISELYMHIEQWNQLVDDWGDSKDFKSDVNALLAAGLATKEDGDINKMKLTAAGHTVAKRLGERNKLWNQRHERW